MPFLTGFIKEKWHPNRTLTVQIWDVIHVAPQVGLEPTTTRLTAECSTDWAIKAKCWHLLIFPGSCPPSIFSASELNFCVRNGNRWTLTAINTNWLNCISNGEPKDMVTRSGFEPLLPAWEAGVLGHLTNGPYIPKKMVHHQGFEPGTPWLRVRCSTNWANGANPKRFTPRKLNK